MTDIAIPAAAQPRHLTQTTAVEQSRAIAEVQAAVVVAQQCPRDIARAEAEMRDSCGRLVVAESAFYRVPNRGEGKSVHLLRELVRIWGNVQYGVHELSRDDEAGMSEIQAFAWDLQTNTRSTRTFQVPHQRMKKVNGKQTREALVDLGDVYLNNQNIGARAVRECIDTVLPKWFTAEAERIARETLRSGEGVPLPDRIAQMVSWFAASFGVKVPQLEEKVGRKRGQWDAGDVASLKILGQSIQRGEVTVDEEFPGATVSAADFAPAPAPEQAKPEPATAGVDVEVVEDEPEPQPEPKLTKREQGKMFALFAQKGIAEDEQKSGIEAIIGHPIPHRTTLTGPEFDAVIARLETLPDADS